MLHGVEPGPRPDVFLQQFLVWTFLGPLLPAERVLYLAIFNIIEKTLFNIFVVELFHHLGPCLRPELAGLSGEICSPTSSHHRNPVCMLMVDCESSLG